MGNLGSHRQDQRELILGRYVQAVGEDILTRKECRDIPSGWVAIVVELFEDVRRYHPETKISELAVGKPKTAYGFRFHVRFVMPNKHGSGDPTRFPRSLRWIEMQARKKALVTCSSCGRPLGTLRKRNLCSVCACKSGFRNFD